MTLSLLIPWHTDIVRKETIFLTYSWICVCVCVCMFIASQPVWVAVTKYLDWVAYKEQKFVACSSEGWEAEIRVPAWLGKGPFLVQSSSCLCGGRSWGSPWSLFYKALIPFTRIPPLCLKHFPKVTPTVLSLLRVKIPTYEFWRDRNIQPIAVNCWTIFQARTRKIIAVMVPNLVAATGYPKIGTEITF